MKKKPIISSVAALLIISILFVAVVALIVGGIAVAVWFLFLDTGNYERYNNEPIREIESNAYRVYFVTEDGDGYFFGGYTLSQGRHYANNTWRSNNSLGEPYPLKFYDGNIQYIYPIEIQDCLFITEDGVLHLMLDTEISEIAQGVSRASKTGYNSKTCYVTVDGALKAIDDYSNHITLIDSDVKDARIFFDDVYVLWNDGRLDKYVLSGEECIFSKKILDNVQEIDVSRTCTKEGNEYISVAIMNVLQNDGKLYAQGVYGLLNQRDTYKYGSPEQIYDELTLIGENVVDFSLENSGTIMQLSDGSAKYFGYDTGLRWETAPKFGEKELDIANVKTACVFERMVYCIDANNLMYVWGGSGEEYYSPSTSEKSRDIFMDQPVIVDFGKKKITY